MTEERYEDFLGPLPQYAPDPRQETFRLSAAPAGSVKRILVDERRERVEIANLGRGWPATWPNLGFLQAAMKKLIELGKLDPGSKKQIHQFLNWAVQRVVRVTIEPQQDVTHVRFWTKDDYGTYGFEFSARLPGARGLENLEGTGATGPGGDV